MSRGIYEHADAVPRVSICEVKRCYSKKDAQTMRNFLEKKKRGIKLRIYPCPFGNHWHLTHKKAR